IQPGRRFGSELSDVAKRFGVGGIFHTDELPAYGISEEEVIKLKRAFNATDEDCVIIVAADEERAVNALNAILERAEVARYGIPEETRRALEDGNTAYMRPLPGAARMYPETDVPPIEITEDMVRRIKLPELFEDRKRRYMREYGINEELASKIARSINFKLFEKIMGMFSSGDAADRIPATLVIRTLTDTMTELMREGVPVQNIGEQHIIKMFEMLAAGDFSK
ncbi:MAG TPA: Glu-tRNA(Gln) amidotransferase GatDE subunit E, partial [Methanomicrobia archaeon]|nr:Glu-tRNA(Gln) amidotransferase GatDE subunit E [Methanomicrobia archaeon]HEX59070.1 Glu-tRNA(Gln) amidotransferase GatDE subunit E [Methanomicrobia archaeon]